MSNEEVKCLAKRHSCTGCTRNDNMPKNGLTWKHDRYYSKAEDKEYYEKM